MWLLQQAWHVKMSFLFPVTNSLAAASVFGKIWLPDPANPKWDSSVTFPRGSVVFKILMSDATDSELPFMKGSPKWSAVRIYLEPDLLLTLRFPFVLDEGNREATGRG